MRIRDHIKASTAGDTTVRLAVELSVEGDWQACRREAWRAAVGFPEDPALKVLLALSRSRCGEEVSATLEALACNEHLSPALRALAREEQARTQRTRHPAADGGRLRRIMIRPAMALIAFYRRQIGPAIGNRCSLSPSCSAYSRQAFRRHGLLLGMALTGDRTVREPDVVARRNNPVHDGRRRRYRDPLHDHTWWLHP